MDRAFRQALNEYGDGVSTDFLLAITSERSQVDPREIKAAVSEVNRPASEREG
jgi:hypothetical protein